MMNLSNIPDDALAQELMRRERIKWFHVQAVMDEQTLRSVGDRAVIVKRYREDMVHQMDRHLFSQNLFQFRQEHNIATGMMTFHLSLPVFIRT